MITKTEKKRLDVWGDVRNYAVHGAFEHVSETDARHFNEGVAEFIGRHRVTLA